MTIIYIHHLEFEFHAKPKWSTVAIPTEQDMYTNICAVQSKQTTEVW